MKYLLIHTYDPTDEHSTEGMPPFQSWLEEMTTRGVNLHGGYLAEPSDATTVQVRDREVLLTDGPFAETKEQIAGYDGSSAPTSTRRSRSRPSIPPPGRARSRSAPSRATAASMPRRAAEDPARGARP